MAHIEDMQLNTDLNVFKWL